MDKIHILNSFEENMPDRQEFEGLLKEIAANLYDYAALETLPGLTKLPLPALKEGSRSEYVREVFLNAIEQLKPPVKDINSNAIEWRPYMILHKRYVEGIPLQEIASALAISDRQMRRDHHRAMQALTVILWEQWGKIQVGQDAGSTGEEPAQFDIRRAPVDLQETLLGVYEILKRRLEEAGADVTLKLDKSLQPILADRVILRQILIRLFHLASLQLTGDQIAVEVNKKDQSARLKFEFKTETNPAGLTESLERLHYWCRQIQAEFSHQTRLGMGEYCLILPFAPQRTILVVDDQEPAINMFRRYLSRSSYTIVGLTQAGQVHELALKLCPALIILDLMMPKTDGWEVLQELKLDDQTTEIPVVICSAWEEPELARTLGAAGFLKKPVTQKALLTLLDSLNLLDFEEIPTGLQ